MNISIVKSNKGHDKLFIDGYCYHLSRETKKTFNWVCAEQKKFKCKGRAITHTVENKHEIMKPPSQHCHDPSSSERVVAEVNYTVKFQSRNSNQPPTIITRESIVNTSSDTRIYLPSIKAQKIKIQRARRNKIKEPVSIEDINIPDNLRYVDGELFVLNEEEFDGDKIILLGTISSLKLLAESSCWIMDGTFDVVPSIMRQLFSIHGCIDGEIVPLVFCLMSKKSKKVYDQLFFNLKKICIENEINIKPERIICDYEKTIVSSASFFFPETTFKGCFFHFGNIIWRKIQKQRLAVKYGNLESFSIQIRMLKALAFVPPNQISSYYTSLSSEFDDEDAKKIGSWFKKNYIGENNRGPRYKPEFWSITNSETGSECFPRTQNSVEAWHRRLKVVVGKRHAGVYKIIEDLSKESVLAKLRIDRLKSGEPIPKKRKQIHRNNKIKKVIRKKDRLTPTQFLKNILLTT